METRKAQMQEAIILVRYYVFRSEEIERLRAIAEMSGKALDEGAGLDMQDLEIKQDKVNGAMKAYMLSHGSDAANIIKDWIMTFTRSGGRSISLMQLCDKYYIDVRTFQRYKKDFLEILASMC